MRIEVNAFNIGDCISKLLKCDKLGIDTETTGLKETDRIFAIQIADELDEYYFNFQNYKDGTPVLPITALNYLEQLTCKHDKTWFIHNAKFDMRMLHYWGVHLNGTIHDTMVIERLIKNNHMVYSLDACLKRRWDTGKNDKVKEWIKTNKAYTWEIVPGKKVRSKNMHYEKVPYHLMFEYGCADVRDVYRLGIDQQKQDLPQKLAKNEYKLTKVCFDMERAGIKIDPVYAKEGMDHEAKEVQKATNDLTDLEGIPFAAGRLWLQSAFDKRGITYPINSRTSLPIFDKHVLEGMDNEIARAMLRFRRHEQYLGTYYSSFLHLADEKNIIHPNMRQAGTDTARFSYSEPNLQNVPKEEEFKDLKHLVRSCFVPREDYCFVMIDYDQQEFRMLLDYAGEHAVIKDIMDNGKDVHQATADMMDVPRKQAKTLNFGLLYGMGKDKLAVALKIKPHEAAFLKAVYFNKLPKIKVLINTIMHRGKQRGWVQNWAKRKYYIDKPDFAYKLPNHLIQGGCADVVRYAMTQLGDYLAPLQSRMLLQIHDEILFEVHKDELHIVPHLKAIMESIYQPFNGLKLTCGVDYSWKSWGQKDKVGGLPNENRN